MRILFFLVALANVALLMWEYNKGAFKPVIEASQQNASVDREPILLVSELKKDSPKSETVLFPSILDALDNNSLTDNLNSVLPKRRMTQNIFESEVTLNLAEQKPTEVEKKPSTVGQNDLKTADTEIPATCYEAGPFADGDYVIWRNRVSGAEGAIQSVSKDEQLVSSYLVYYPAEKTMAESEANLQMLKDQGISDIMLFRTGEDKGQISLGVFKNENRALLRKSQMLAKGIPAEIKARYKTKVKTQKYVQFKNDDKVLKSLNEFQKTHPGFTVKQVDSCL